MSEKQQKVRRTVLLALWILLFGSFYLAHWGLNWDRSPLIGGLSLLSTGVLWFAQLAWIAVYGKAEPKLARLSLIFLGLFFFMLIWDGPITV